MPALFNPPRMLSVLSVGLLGACASAPPVNSLATVAVQATVTQADLQATHSYAIRVRAALQRAGIGREVVLAGRVVRVACATVRCAASRSFRAFSSRATVSFTRFWIA